MTHIICEGSSLFMFVCVSDLYDALVAPKLKVPLLVETWQHGAHCVVLPSNCSTEYKARASVAITSKRLYHHDTAKNSNYILYEFAATVFCCIVAVMVRAPNDAQFACL